MWTNPRSPQSPAAYHQTIVSPVPLTTQTPCPRAVVRRRHVALPFKPLPPRTAELGRQQHLPPRRAQDSLVSKDPSNPRLQGPPRSGRQLHLPLQQWLVSP